MGLSSVLSTAVTGLQASETTIDVAGNNVANANTVGFKASTAVFATQFLQTLSLGSAPTEQNGGTNPRHIGLGTQVAAITTDFTQGTLEISGTPSDLAIQGDGFFIVRDSAGEQLYTRNGKFQVNAQNELVTTSGERLLGFGVDDDFNIQPTTLEPLSIPLGAAAVAKATENVFLEGTLTPTGDVATTAAIIQTGALGDSELSFPTGAATVTQAAVPQVTTMTNTEQTIGGAALDVNSTYRYRIVFADAPLAPPPAGTESPPSVEYTVTLTGTENQITLNNIPTDGTATNPYQTRRIYRTEGNGTDFFLVAEIPNNTTTTFVDNLTDATIAAQQPLDDAGISGNYSYYITFADALGGPGFGNESRPSPLIGPINIGANQRIRLTDIPALPGPPWQAVRIYRNLANDDSEFHFVTELASGGPGVSFTDNIDSTVIEANAEVDLVGPRITTATLLTDVVRENDGVYENLFEIGTLEFTGRKGGRQLSTKGLEITAATTVLDLINFMEDSLGIAEPPGPDPLNPIPTDITGANPGGTVTANGEIRLIGNNGVQNALDVGLSGLQSVVGGARSQINMPFGTVQEAVGEGAVADFVVYDSLGIPLNVRVTAVLESTSDSQTTYRWFADSPDNQQVAGVDINVGTGLITFDGEGKLIGSTNATVSIGRRDVPSASPLEFELDFSSLSGLADDSASLAATRQDGFAPGKLISFIISEDGIIRGVFDNGAGRDLGMIRLARFANASGLQQRGRNLFSQGVNSGLPVVGDPGEQGIGTIIAGALELSNTDIGENLIDLILASTQYRGSTRVITAAQQLLDELLNLRR